MIARRELQACYGLAAGSANLRLAQRPDQEAIAMAGGQQQMLAIARATIVKPDLIMLDEPSEGIMPVQERYCLV